MKIAYLVPVTERPSWGMGIIYDTVKILIDNGYDACIVKEKDFWVPKWLGLSVPFKDFSWLNRNIKNEDILVVPEAMVDLPFLKKIKARKILFIQAAAFLFEKMPKGEDHVSLGFEHVIIIMPHMEAIVEKHIRLPYSTIPPYVASYFYSGDILKKRKKKILIYPKFHQIDYSVVKHLIDRHIIRRRTNWLHNVITNGNWSVRELKGLTHTEVANEMKSSSFFISLNTFEALNTSVAEAMAGGSMVFCYEGFGPRDYLKNNENAFVFSNSEAYQLVEKVCDWMDNFEDRQVEFNSIRTVARQTSLQYQREIAERKLTEFYKALS